MTLVCEPPHSAKVRSPESWASIMVSPSPLSSDEVQDGVRTWVLMMFGVELGGSDPDRPWAHGCRSGEATVATTSYSGEGGEELLTANRLALREDVGDSLHLFEPDTLSEACCAC